MAFAELAAPESTRPARALSAARRADLWMLLVLLIAAIATRAVYIGDPALGFDEALYLLVGDHMWHGALPYVDIWDRKPVGLFLLYAAIRPFSSDGVFAYQIAALLSATATAFVIARIAIRFVARPAATVAGCLYLIWLPILDGAGGQSPVFYNLLMASAALLVMKAGEDSRGDHRRLTVGAMLLVGIAIEIKTTAVFEGAFFGIWLLVRAWRSGASWSRFLTDAGLWVLAAALPMLLALGFYAAIGHFSAFWFANVQAAMLKREPAGFSELPNIRITATAIGPLFLGWLAGSVILLCRRSPHIAFMLAWSIVALCGYFVIGHFYIHYAIPALVPLSAVCAVLAENVVGMGAVLTVALLWNNAATSFPLYTKSPRHRQATEAIVEAMAPYARHGCLYLNSGPPVVYIRTHSCLPTVYAFPAHLSEEAETRTIDTRAEMAKLLATKPSAILFGDREYQAHYPHPRNEVTDAMVTRALAAGYHLKASLQDPDAKGHLQMFVRNDLR